MEPLDVDSGRSNSGHLRGMPGVRMALNPSAGEGTVRACYDAPLGARGFVMLVRCCGDGQCDPEHAGGETGGKANAGCFRPDGQPVEGARAAELATQAGWCSMGGGYWLCPWHLDFYLTHPAELAVLRGRVEHEKRMKEILAEGGIVL